MRRSEVARSNDAARRRGSRNETARSARSNKTPRCVPPYKVSMTWPRTRELGMSLVTVKHSCDTLATPATHLQQALIILASCGLNVSTCTLFYPASAGNRAPHHTRGHNVAELLNLASMPGPSDAATLRHGQSTRYAGARGAYQSSSLPNLSAASTRSFVIPGSWAEWPASSTILRSQPSPHAFLRSNAERVWCQR